MARTGGELESTFTALLHEALTPLPSYGDSPLLDELARHADERKAADDAYLAGLPGRERIYVLRMRRHAALEERFRAALDFSRCDCGDGCW